MDKVSPTLDTDALRSFVAGVELGSFALAAQSLHRSTSAVSAQLKKLERQSGTRLVVKQGRGLALTAAGELMLSYARRLLALNDEALLAIRGERLTGEVRLGMQEDFGETLMPDILGQFSRRHPGVRITARVDRNQALFEGIRDGELDLALAWTLEPPSGALLAQLPLRWITHPSFEPADYLSQRTPLPLVLFEAPCLIRKLALAALDEAGIPWRIAFTSHSLSGIWAAVNAGLGVTVRSKVGMPSTLRPLDQREMAPLPLLGVTLLEKHAHPAGAIGHLRQLLINAVNNAC